MYELFYTLLTYAKHKPLVFEQLIIINEDCTLINHLFFLFNHKSSNLRLTSD